MHNLIRGVARAAVGLGKLPLSLPQNEWPWPSTADRHRRRRQAPFSLRMTDGYGAARDHAGTSRRRGNTRKSIGPLPYAKGLSGAARAGRQQSRARGWSWVLVIACRTPGAPRGPGCAGGTGRACPGTPGSFLATPRPAACPWTGSGPSSLRLMVAPVPGACTATCPNRAASGATSAFEACRRRFSVVLGAAIRAPAPAPAEEAPSFLGPEASSIQSEASPAPS